MKGCCLAPLAQLAKVYPSPPSDGTGDPGVPGRRMKAKSSHLWLFVVYVFENRC